MTGDALLTILTTVVAGVLTAAISVRFALRRFRAEKWWERRADAYSALFIALFNVQRSLRYEIRRLEENIESPEDYARDLRDGARSGYAELRRAAVIGTFMFGTSTAARLEELVNTIDDPGYNIDHYDHVSAHLTAVTGALHDLKPLSKRDLALPD